MKLVFATNNQNKLEELQSLLGSSIDLLSLKDINCSDEIPETGVTLEENALQKSKYIHDRFNINCFADDTGLEIEALNGEPGVYSARYAGEDKDASKNMEKVIDKMRSVSNRKARFRTIISLILDNLEYQFEGIVDGIITTEKSGSKGFGYDPIFIPNGYQESFAEMNLAEKNKISHRARAVQKLIKFLTEL